MLSATVASDDCSAMGATDCVGPLLGLEVGTMDLFVSSLGFGRFAGFVLG